MPPFRITQSCPTCKGQGRICSIDYQAMIDARRAKDITVTVMAKRLKTSPTAILRIESGAKPLTPEIEQAYIELLPKKARGGP